MKILISGRDGQLGSDATVYFRKTHEVFAPDEKDFDIVNLEAVLYLVSHLSPDIVLNCAAYTHVDSCESEKETAWKVNVDGPLTLAVAVKKYGGKLIHISTDYVFSGKREIPQPYVEDDETGPLSQYGRTKLEGELAVRRETDNHIIIRTAWVYGVNGHNFLKTMLRLAVHNPGKEIRVVHDQHGSPTWSYSLTEQIGKMLEGDHRGTYHASAEGHCTWYELSRYFLHKMNIEHNVVPCTTEDYPTPAVRPQNSILENKRLKEEGISVLPHWQDGIDQFVNLHREYLLDEARGSRI